MNAVRVMGLDGVELEKKDTIDTIDTILSKHKVC